MSTKNIPTWPRERDLATYQKYTNLDFATLLSNVATWIDIGARTGIALSESKRLCEANLVGVNAHDIEMLPGITALFATLPEELSIYNRYYRKADIVTDIYGAFSYSEDPVAVLIYEALLLKAGGVAVIVSLQSKLGNRKNIADITHFFSNVLGQKCTFKRFRTYTNTLKKPINSVRITITGQCLVRDSYENLLVQAHQFIGEPKQKQAIYRPEDRSTEIRKTIYTSNA